MMSGQADKAAWQALGVLLERRRVELDIRFANLTLFAQERGIDYRLAWDAEHGARANYRRPTIAAIEVAYGLEPGFIRSVVDGDSGRAVTDEPAPHYDDPDEQRIANEVWAANIGVADDPELRRGFVTYAISLRRKRLGGTSGDGKQRRRA